MTDDEMPDAPIDGMADRSAALRAEWRAEAEEWSRAALERWEHGRGLADVLRDSMLRGDVVTVAFAAVAWSGTVDAVGDTVARLGSVDVRLGDEAPFVVRVRAGMGEGRRDAATLTTFVARLRELDGTAVCIGTSSATLEGRLRVGRDQLRLTDRNGGVAYVPAGSVWWVRVLGDD